MTETYNTSLVLTYDFAYYGADVSNSIINTGVTTDVVAQVADFEENLVPAPDYAPWTADNLLVAVWIGVNDVGECFWESALYSTCPIDDVMTKYFDLMQNLYDDGVRNFVVNLVPRKSPRTLRLCTLLEYALAHLTVSLQLSTRLPPSQARRTSRPSSPTSSHTTRSLPATWRRSNLPTRTSPSARSSTQLRTSGRFLTTQRPTVLTATSLPPTPTARVRSGTTGTTLDKPSTSLWPRVSSRP